MNLPDNIREEILEYLHLELGEAPNDKSSLNLEDIQFEGIYDIHGIPTHYYKFGRSIWATVEPFGDSYMIGMTDLSPVPIEKKKLYNRLIIESNDKSFLESLKLKDYGNGFYCIPEYKEIEINSDEKISVLAEVNINMKPQQVVLSIKEGHKEIYIKSSISIEMKYVTSNGTILYFSLGK